MKPNMLVLESLLKKSQASFQEPPKGQGLRRLVVFAFIQILPFVIRNRRQ